MAGNAKQAARATVWRNLNEAVGYLITGLLVLSGILYLIAFVMYGPEILGPAYRKIEYAGKLEDLTADKIPNIKVSQNSAVTYRLVKRVGDTLIPCAVERLDLAGEKAAISSFEYDQTRGVTTVRSNFRHESIVGQIWLSNGATPVPIKFTDDAPIATISTDIVVPSCQTLPGVTSDGASDRHDGS